jgi:hypothetical protein
MPSRVGRRIGHSRSGVAAEVGQLLGHGRQAWIRHGARKSQGVSEAHPSLRSLGFMAWTCVTRVHGPAMGCWPLSLVLALLSSDDLQTLFVPSFLPHHTHFRSLECLSPGSLPSFSPSHSLACSFASSFPPPTGRFSLPPTCRHVLTHPCSASYLPCLPPLSLLALK